MNLRWGLLAAGTIAAEFAEGIKESETGELAAVAARSGDRAAEFAALHDVPNSYGSYDELLSDDEIDVVYVSTPHALHAEWAIKAADAGKHVLCEKPLTLTHADAETVVEAARRNDVFLMEAYMYRIHPLIRLMVELIESGVLGEVRAVDVTFSDDAADSAAARLSDPALGGGGILDVGGYCTSVARLVSEVATGAGAVVPTEVSGMARLDPATGVDEFAMGLLRLPGDIIAQISCGFRLRQHDHIRVYGTEAQLYLPRPPWLFGMRKPGVTSEIVVTQPDGTVEVLEVEARQGLFAREADHVAAHIADRQSPDVSWRETLANMRTLDLWREAAGMR
jgi:predicted dehydrogenase